MKHTTASNSISIQVRAPEGFKVSGETKIKPEEVSEEEQIKSLISEIMVALSVMDEQKKKIEASVLKLKKMFPCEGCG